MAVQKERLGTIVAAKIADLVASDAYKVGDRIPTEPEICEQFNVSRTVVREAVALLRSEGLLVSRHGVGVFVANKRPTVPFRISPDIADTAAEIMRVLELRIGVEVEGAGLAAERCSEADCANIDRALARGDAAIDVDEAESWDFEFHLAIAKATNNAYFHQFLEFLGPRVIPRLRLRDRYASDDSRGDYLRGIQAEHRRIASAISRGSVLDAREAMRFHLSGSRERYRTLAGTDQVLHQSKDDQ